MALDETILHALKEAYADYLRMRENLATLVKDTAQQHTKKTPSPSAPTVKSATMDPYDWLWATGRPMHEHPEYEARSRLTFRKYSNWIEGLMRRHPGHRVEASNEANWRIMEMLDSLREMSEDDLRQTPLFLIVAPFALHDRDAAPNAATVFRLMDSIIHGTIKDNRPAHYLLGEGLHVLWRRPDLMAIALIVGPTALRHYERLKNAVLKRKSGSRGQRPNGS